MSVGDNIRKIREAKHILQVQLAEDVGITQAMICQIERGTKNPSLQVGMAIAEKLGVTVEELLK